MARYIVKRFLLMIPTMIGVAALIFFLMRVVPGDIVELRLSGESGSASKEQIAIERARFGLDRPLWQQFAEWMWGLARLDFGRSMWTGASIGSEIQLRFMLSLELAVLATAVAVLLAIPLGRHRRAQAGQLGGLCRAHLLHRGDCHALVLARHRVDPGPAHHLQVAAADGVHAARGSTRGRTSPSSSGRRSPWAIATRRWRRA